MNIIELSNGSVVDEVYKQLFNMAVSLKDAHGFDWSCLRRAVDNCLLVTSYVPPQTLVIKIHQSKIKIIEASTSESIEIIELADPNYLDVFECALIKLQQTNRV